MRSLAHFRKGSRNSSLRRILGVSEAVGTVLLLGISITIAGGIALWTANIDEGEEGLYVDLWAEVRGDDLVIVHRGGDLLDGTDTMVTISDPGAGQINRWTYYELTEFQGTPDETWSSGEELVVSISDPSIPDTFRVVVTSRMERGTDVVILESVLNKVGIIGNLPDLAVTLVQFLEPDGSICSDNTLYETGTYLIRINVKNFGIDMGSVHFRKETGNTVTNLRIFDSEETISFSAVFISHYYGSGTEVDPYLDPAYFGVLHSGENMSFTFNWTVGSSLPRSLGLHTLNVKINPVFNGELNYRNNYVQRKFKVDKELIPLQIHGPDPGIYDIYFSNDAPHSGDEVTVTVVVQNSGDEPVTQDWHVNLIVSTWEPIMRNIEGDLIPDWRMDYSGHYGNWRSEDNGFTLTNDNIFPTCVKLDIELLPGAYLFFYFTLEARVDVPGGEQLVYAAIDAYQTDGKPQGIHYLEGDYWKDNKDFGIIQVLPRILVVDDDNAITGSDSDMTSSVIESLVGSGVTIDRVYVAQQVSDGNVTRDAPAFSYNHTEIPAPAMEDFDIVIWVTGYDENPLTNKPKGTPTSPGGNIQEMMDYMDSNKYLLIIGTSPFDHFANYFIEGNTQSYIIPPPQTTLDASVFLYDYLGIKKITENLPLPTGKGQYLYGMDTDADGLTPSPGTGEDYLIELVEQEPFNDGMTFFLIRDDVESGLAGLETPVGVMTTFAEKDLSIPRYNYIRSFSTPDQDLHDAQYRAAVMAWNVTEIKYLNEKIDLFANVLRWFDWEVQVGRDLAVTRMNLYIITEASEGVWENVIVDEETSPKYLDTVLLEAYIRNNGPDLESTSLMFYVTGPDGIELPITPNIPDPRSDLENEEYDNPSDISGLVGQGGEVVIYKLWLAVGVGTYTFRVVVDPFHLISEINEENNDISYSTSTVTSFVTKNNILVVDDDMSDNNFALDVDTQAHKSERVIDYSLSGSGVPPSTAVIGALEDLGYEYDLHTVENVYSVVAWDYESDLSILDLKRFNSVIWIVGDSGTADATARETFTDQDLVGIKKYLDGDYPEAKYLSEEHHENLMMVGTSIISEMMMEPAHNIDYWADGVLRSFTISQFIEEYMGIEAVPPTTGVADGLYGPQEGDFIDDIYLGVVYNGDEILDPFIYESFTPITRVEGYIEPSDGMYVEDGIGGYRLVSHQYDLRDGSRRFNFVMQSWQINHASFDTVEGPLQEILFLPLHWFNTPEWRPDLVGRDCKMSVDEENPVIGSSYLVQAEIANLGGVAGGGTVRFMDGTILIKSENVYLEPDRATTLEAIWKPNFAGDRSISLWLDLYDDYDEVFDVSNNRPSIMKSIYIFWDDMESGDENWDHDSTKLLINGESPLDYLGKPTDTNINDTWEVMDGFHLNSQVDNPTVEGIFHSSPNSYYMYEPDQGNLDRKPLDLALVLDTSGSMNNDGYDPGIGDYQPIGNMKIAAINLINQMRPEDRLMVTIYNAGVPYSYPLTTMDDAGKNTLKSVISSLKADSYSPLWDAMGGAVTQLNLNMRVEAFPAVIAMTDGDDLGVAGREDGSAMYCPGSEAGSDYKTSTWGTASGLKYGDPGVSFFNQDGSIGMGHDVYRTYEDELLHELIWQDLNAPGEKRTGLLYSPIPVYNIGLGVAPHESVPLSPKISSYPFTTEYDLWRISETSTAEYTYLSASNGLKQAFQDAFDSIENDASGGTRSSAPTRAIGPWTDGLELPSGKSMSTYFVDLSYADSAELSFNHKYNLRSGYNGGILEIYHQDTDRWEYIQPDQPYTGNFPEDEWPSLLDDFGNQIRWCWNGLSGGGTLGWDYVTVDLDDYLGQQIKIRFRYIHLDGGTGYGWFLDDVTLKISTDDGDQARKDMSVDNWALITASTPGIQSYSGSHSWFCGVTSNGGDLNDGVDNSLYTRQIDLTNVGTAGLQAMVKFNIDQAPDRPPDGFRIEVSTDNKQTWVPLNLGVRSSWGVSGTDADIDDGIPNDNKAYTGLDLEANGRFWVPIGTLTRVNADLSAFTGSVINIRFRVVTNTDARHYDQTAVPDPLFRGIFIDDVLIYGETLGSTRSYEQVPDLTLSHDRDLDMPETMVQEALTDTEPGPEEEKSSSVVHDTASSDPVFEEVDAGSQTNGSILFMVSVSSISVLIAIVAMMVLRKNAGKGYPGV